MPHRSKDIIRAARRGAAREQGDIVEVGTTGGNHQVVTVERGGERRKVFLPLTPSKQSSEANAEALVRRVIRGLPPGDVSEFLTWF